MTVEMADVVTIPKQEPEAQKLPDHAPKVVNWADKKETVDETLKWIRTYRDRFIHQSERASAETKWKNSDKMLRCSLTDDSASDQHQYTLSNYPSLSFFRRHRRITTEEKAVILGSDDLPVRYEPIPGADDYSPDQGRQICDARNMLLAYTMEVDESKAKIGDALHFVNKYADLVIGVEWDQQTERRKVRERRTHDDAGNELPKPQYRWVEKDVVIADHPCFRVYDIKDWWFDARIDDLEKQRAFGHRSRIGLETAWAEARAGRWKNVARITPENLYGGEWMYKSETLGDRKDNADLDDSTVEPTGEFAREDWFIRIPVDAEGKWNPDETVPQWHWVVVVGDPTSETAVVVRHSPYPYPKMNFKLIHSHPDDIGAYHMGFVDIGKANYDEERTTINQMVDNKTLRNKKPWVIESQSLMTRDLTFSANKAIIKRPGAPDPHEIEVQDTTQSAVQHLEFFRTDGDEAFGTQGPMAGEMPPARTTSTTTKVVFEQSIKTALDKAYYMAGQILPFYADQVASQWEHFGDPERIVYITKGKSVIEIKPGELWGPYRCRVVSVQDFQNEAIQKQEEAQLVSALGPLLLQAGRKDVVEKWAKSILKRRRMEGVDEWFAQRMDYDAVHVADMENENILLNAAFDMPKPGENHEVHLSRHEPAAAEYATIPREQRNEAGLSMMQQHIERTRFLMAQEQGAAAMATGAGAQPQQAQAPGAPAEMAGQAVGDLMAAPEGQVGNVPATA